MVYLAARSSIVANCKEKRTHVSLNDPDAHLRLWGSL